MANRMPGCRSIIVTALLMCASLPSVALAQEVRISVGKASGQVGTKNHRVTVSMDNAGHNVTGIQIEICDQGNHLICKGCESIGRAAGFECSANESRKGCANFVMYSMGGTLLAGSGPIALLTYDISERAPAGECVTLKANPGYKDRGQFVGGISDENRQRLKAVGEDGEFCFTDDQSTTTTADSSGTTTRPATTTTQESTATTATESGARINIREDENIPRTTTISAAQPEGQALSARTESASDLKTGKQPAQNVPAKAEKGAPQQEPASQKEPRPPAQTTTIAPSSPYTVLLTPSWCMLDSGGKLQFGATTLMNRQEVEGTYTWEILPPSTIGSTIDKTGLLSAGKSTGRSSAMETVRVVDIVHGGTAGTAAILIKAESGSSAECSISLSPLSATVLPGQTLQFQAASAGKKCAKSLYVWDISSRIGSSITTEGIYTAEKIDDCDTAIDIITVQDTANELTAHALVTVSAGEDAGNKASGAQQKSSAWGKVLLVAVALLLICVIAIVLLGFVLRKKR